MTEITNLDLMGEKLTNPFSYYRKLIDGLLKTGVRIVPLNEFSKATGKVIALRHDVDGNPMSALRSARYLAQRGVPGSFYLLSTAPYYGTFYGDSFERSPLVDHLVHCMIVAGCEIGLHNDVFGAEKNHHVYGPTHLTTELAHLRSLGATITGTVTHNTSLSYGAENFEVFKERILWNRQTTRSIGALSEKKLGLTYEGTFPIKKQVSLFDVHAFEEILGGVRTKEWMRTYLKFNPFYDKSHVEIWLIGEDLWVASGPDFFDWEINLVQVFERIMAVPDDLKIVIVLHPDYFEVEPPELVVSPLYSLPQVRYPFLPPFIRRIGHQLLRLPGYLRSLIKTLRVSLTPMNIRWKTAQRNYTDWTLESLSPEYLEDVIATGKRFMEYVGDPEKCLDVGCGNGLFGGKTYRQIGYSYLKRTPTSYVVGLDPLPLESNIPWADECRMGMAEDIPFDDAHFNKVVIATSLDHVLSPTNCIRECYRVLKSNGFLYIWTAFKGYTDKHHPHDFNEPSLRALLTDNGFEVLDLRLVSANAQVFVKARTHPEFDLQWREMPSPDTLLTQNRIDELLDLTQLAPSFFRDIHCFDVGCGSGRFTWAMQQLGAKVASCDISEDAIDLCREINKDAYVQDIYDLDPDPIYDFVLCWGVLHHLPRPELGFEKVASQVKQGGILHIMVYHKDTQRRYESGRRQWSHLSKKERIALCEKMIRRYGGNLHGWWDAFNPQYNWSYSPNQVRKWFERSGFTDITVTLEKSINIRGVKQ